MKPFEPQNTKPASCIGCREFSCPDINKNGYPVPAADLNPENKGNDCTGSG